MRRFTFMLLIALVHPVGAALAAEQAGLGGYRATLTPDNRVKYTLDAPDFTFTRITATNSTETEITIAGSNEAPVVIRFGGGNDISVERSGQVVSIRHGDGTDKLEAVAALLNGRAVSAFRRLVGSYERELMNDTAILSAKTSPFAYWDRAGARLLCSAEFLAGALSAETQFVSCSGLSPLKIQ